MLALVLVPSVTGCTQTDYEITISHHDPARAMPGITYFQTHIFHPGLFSVDMDGAVLWHRHESGVVLGGNGVGMDVMRDGKVLAMDDLSHPTIIDPVTDETVWADTQHVAHHSLDETPWGTVMTLQTEHVPLDYPPWKRCPVYGDRIVEIDVPTGEVLWEWHLGDHLDPVEHHAEGTCADGIGMVDWSHCNTVKVVGQYTLEGVTYSPVVLLHSRNLDTFWLIDYVSGEVIFSCGQHGDFGRREPPAEPLFNTAHELEMLANGNFIIFDNGELRAEPRSRALEFAVDPVAGTTDEVWSWTEPEEVMFSRWGGDADRLPNGNTLVSNVQEARIVEVDPAGEKVWQLEIDSAMIAADSFTVFMAKRVHDE